MKKLILCFILLSNIQTIHACGWWPMGEEVRFSLFAQNLAGHDDLVPLFYSSDYFNEYQPNQFHGPKENFEEWKWYFRNKFTLDEVDEVVYQMFISDYNNKYERNALFRYLRNGEDNETKDYLLFAKRVQSLLDFNPWRKESFNLEQLKQVQNIAKRKAQHKALTSSYITTRYAYQFIVISYYLVDYANVKLGYQAFFKNERTSVIKSWAMLYYANVQDSNIDRLYLYAKLFPHAKSKCKYIYNHFTDNDSIINLVLEKCKSNKERANVLSIMAFKNPGPAIKQIEEIATLNAQSDMLNVLLIREINKIEDWYLTKRYTGFSNDIYFESSWDNESVDRINLQRDKKYLTSVLKLCEKIVRHQKPKNLALWYTSIAYMHLMLNHYDKTEKAIELALKQYTCTNEMKAQLRVISILNIVSNAKKWDTKFQNELYSRLIQIQDLKDDVINYKGLKNEMMLAISRQFLEKGNVVVAALFEGKINDRVEDYMSWSDNKKQVFNLLDAEADSKVIDDFFQMWNKPNKTNLEHYLLDSLNKYKWELTDLWATQYVREDKLEKALDIYNTIPQKFWTERDTFDMIYHHFGEFSSDPFESTFFGYHSNQKSDIHYTKPQFIKKILDLKQQLKYKNGNPSYTALLLGNAYYNMTVHGNSPYMVEYFMYRSFSRSLERDRSYFYNNERALKYYKLAEKLSPNKKFGAFCFRMIVKCVSQAKLYQEYAYGNNDMSIDSKIWKKFALKYPQHYNKLQYCDHFDDYASFWKE